MPDPRESLCEESGVAPDAGRRVLVVSTVEHVGERLGGRLHPNDAVKVVVPAVGQGIVDWLSNDERAFAAADDVAGRIGEELPGEAFEAGPGEADLGLAIRDALATFPADEILVAVPAGATGVDVAIAADEPSPVGRTVDGVPVSVVTVDAVA